MRLSLALSLLETRKQRGKPVKPGPGTTQLHHQGPGMLDQAAGHEYHVGHNGLDPAPGGLLQSQTFCMAISWAITLSML